MKNKKTILGSSAAIVASMALIAGGTFALWSDYAEVEDNSSGAGTLTLELKGGNGVEDPVPFTFGDLAPGENKEFERFLASVNGDAVPDGALSLRLIDGSLTNEENGCASNSEEAEENGDCNAAGDAGEFSSQAIMKVEHSAPITASNCGQASYSTVFEDTLDQFDSANDISLGTMSAGEGICTKLTITLPSTADNTTQGDGSTFDLRYDLEQV